MWKRSSNLSRQARDKHAFRQRKRNVWAEASAQQLQSYSSPVASSIMAASFINFRIHFCRFCCDCADPRRERRFWVNFPSVTCRKPVLANIAVRILYVIRLKRYYGIVLTRVSFVSQRYDQPFQLAEIIEPFQQFVQQLPQLQPASSSSSSSGAAPSYSSGGGGVFLCCELLGCQHTHRLENACLFELFLCLSRACLGKMIVFNVQMAQQDAFSYLLVVVAVRL